MTTDTLATAVRVAERAAERRRFWDACFAATMGGLASQFIQNTPALEAGTAWGESEGASAAEWCRRWADAALAERDKRWPPATTAPLPPDGHALGAWRDPP